jgi:hypothetical protein
MNIKNVKFLYKNNFVARNELSKSIHSNLEIHKKELTIPFRVTLQRINSNIAISWIFFSLQLSVYSITYSKYVSFHI